MYRFLRGLCLFVLAALAGCDSHSQQFHYETAARLCSACLTWLASFGH